MAAPAPQAVPALTEEERQRLINQLLYVLDSGSDQECAVCLESVKRGVITACAHVYCRPCIEAVIDNEQVHLNDFSVRGMIYTLYVVKSLAWIIPPSHHCFKAAQTINLNLETRNWDRPGCRAHLSGQDVDLA